MQWVIILSFVQASLHCGSTFALEGSRTSLTSPVELARLVDLCPERLGINIEFDAAALCGTVTLRLGAGVSDDELWLLTNRVLASHGFASVRMPGDEMFSIVRAADAPGMAQLQADAEESTAASFITAIARMEHQPARKIANFIKLVLFKTGSAINPIADTGLLLISDLNPRVDEAMRLIEMLDVPIDPTGIVRIPVVRLGAAMVAFMDMRLCATFRVSPHLWVVPDAP